MMFKVLYDVLSFIKVEPHHVGWKSMSHSFDISGVRITYRKVRAHGSMQIVVENLITRQWLQLSLMIY